eukprot:3066541-Amphidinium_carterae.1
MSKVLLALQYGPKLLKNDSGHIFHKTHSHPVTVSSSGSLPQPTSAQQPVPPSAGQGNLG